MIISVNENSQGSLEQCKFSEISRHAIQESRRPHYLTEALIIDVKGQNENVVITDCYRVQSSIKKYTGRININSSKFGSAFEVGFFEKVEFLKGI